MVKPVTGVGAVAVLMAVFLAAPAAAVHPPDVPAALTVSVEPETVAPGQTVRVRLDLAPVDGVKINRYPQIKLIVDAHEGLVAAAEARVGDARPPSTDTMERGGNYFATVEPVELELTVDSAASSGSHEVEGKLTYFYCVTKNGFFCAPKRTTVSIPLRVR